MDDMMGSMTGDAMLGRRLEAYAGARLSPDLATSTRLRARVLAVAHRRAALAHADAALIVLPRPEPATAGASLSARVRGARHGSSRRGRAGWPRAAGILLAASLAIGLATGAAIAARPSGPLYDARLWAETLTLPEDPSARAVAELDRLERRLVELAAASRSGDTAGVTAALVAYEAIMEEAAASAILSGDDVAAAILETGVGQHLEVLRALVARVPSNAGVAISRAIGAAIERSSDAVERIGASRPAQGDDHGSGTTGGGPTAEPTDRADPIEPTDRPDPTAKPTKTPPPEPATVPADPATPDPKPTHEVPPAPTPEPQDGPGKPPGQPALLKPGQGGPPEQGG